jgi:hypothetical protein
MHKVILLVVSTFEQGLRRWQSHGSVSRWETLIERWSRSDWTLSSAFGQCWLWHAERLRSSYCDWTRGCCAPARPVTCWWQADDADQTQVNHYSSSGEVMTSAEFTRGADQCVDRMRGCVKSLATEHVWSCFCGVGTCPVNSPKSIVIHLTDLI